MEVVLLVRATWGRQRSAIQGQGEDEVPTSPGKMKCDGLNLQTTEEIEGGNKCCCPSVTKSCLTL